MDNRLQDGYLKNYGLNPSKDIIFFCTPNMARWGLGPTCPISTIKLNTPSSSVKVMNRCSYTCTPPYPLHRKHSNNFTFLVRNSKVHPRRGHESPQGGYKYSSTLSSTLVLDRYGWSTPRPSRFTPEKDPLPIVLEAGWAPVPVWMGAENPAPTGIWSPDRPARSELSWPTLSGNTSGNKIKTWVCVLK
jgi:hypothetical protein